MSETIEVPDDGPLGHWIDGQVRLQAQLRAAEEEVKVLRQIVATLVQGSGGTVELDQETLSETIPLEVLRYETRTGPVIELRA